VFDISFGEMMVVGVVALVVIGPERLPKVARTVGSFVGKAQRYATQVRNDINAQIELEELRKTQQEIRDAAQQFEQSISQEIKAAETEVAHIHQQVDEIRADLNQIEAAKTESGSGQSPSAGRAEFARTYGKP
jgi:sec-independent protein translocase protein TatB